MVYGFLPSQILLPLGVEFSKDEMSQNVKPSQVISYMLNAPHLAISYLHLKSQVDLHCFFPWDILVQYIKIVIQCLYQPFVFIKFNILLPFLKKSKPNNVVQISIVLY